MSDNSNSISNSAALLAALPGAAYRCLPDEHWSMMELGPQIESITGYSPDQFLSGALAYADIILEEDREAIREGLFHDISKGVFNLEYRIQHLNGEVRYVWEQGQGIFDDEGKLQGLTGYICDATPSLLQAQRNRKAQSVILELAKNPHLARGDVEIFCRHLAKAVADLLGVERAGVWLLDPSGDNIVLQTLYRNSCDRYQSGLSLSVADNLDYYHTLLAERALHNRDATRDARVQSLLDLYIRELNVKSMLHCAVLQAGEVIGVVCAESVGEFHYWSSEEISFVADVADQVAHAVSNREIRAAENRLLELQASQETKSQFMSMLSHELRTPLNGVLGMTELLNTTSLDKQQSEYVGLIESSGELLLKVIGDILDYSRIEAGEVEMHPQPTDLQHLSSDCLELLRSEAVSKGLALNLSIDAAVPALCLLDTRRLQQVLLNLLMNAIKFTQQGSVTLKINVEDDAWLALSVIDTGIGIASQLQDQMFEAFVQNRQANAEESLKGAGLGLSICKGLVRLMKGRIEVQSEEGKGSQFKVLLPLEPFVGKTTQTKPVNDADYKDMKVLVAEDNPVNRKVVQGMLKLFKVEADLCDDGAQALAKVQSESGCYDLILMDCEMPVMDGFEAVEAIRQLPAPKGSTYIAALTAHALQEYRDKATEVGMNAYLTKPLQKQALADLLEQLQP
jgi:signal transduction histidine kinase/CheY-like chemotaxis protein